MVVVIEGKPNLDCNHSSHRSHGRLHQGSGRSMTTSYLIIPFLPDHPFSTQFQLRNHSTKVAHAYLVFSPLSSQPVPYTCIILYDFTISLPPRNSNDKRRQFGHISPYPSWHERQAGQGSFQEIYPCTWRKSCTRKSAYYLEVRENPQVRHKGLIITLRLPVLTRTI